MNELCTFGGAEGKENWATVLLTATQPGIIATIYLSPIALLKNKTP
jgi:hypothetical protein